MQQGACPIRADKRLGNEIMYIRLRKWARLASGNKWVIHRFIAGGSFFDLYAFFFLKIAEKHLSVRKKVRTFATSKWHDTLPCGVMVARRILVPPVRVRILPRQQKTLTIFRKRLFFAPMIAVMLPNVFWFITVR